MVEYSFPLDRVFAALADPTRRDILSRLITRELNVSEIAQAYDISLAAVSKHLKILEEATLIRKRKKGKERIVSLQPGALLQASRYIKQYDQLWSERFDNL